MCLKSRANSTFLYIEPNHLLKIIEEWIISFLDPLLNFCGYPLMCIGFLYMWNLYSLHCYY